MKIKTKLQITTVVSLIVALVIGLILFFSARQVNEAIKKEKAADEIIRGLFELNILTNEYLIHHEERAKIQWQLKHDSIKRFLEGVEVESPEKIVLLKRMRERHKDIKNIFSQMVSNYEGYGDEKEGVSQELNEMLVGNLDAKSRSMVSDAYQLAEISSARLIASQQKAYLLVLLFSLIMAVVVATVSFSIHSGVVKPIGKLHEGTEIIGAGNLNYKVGTMAKDEVGQLSRAFDRMTIQLEESFAGLEKEIAERKEAEEALEESQKRYRQVVENAVEIIYSTDTNGNFTWANSTALKAVGYTLEELQRFNYLDFVVPEHRDRLSKIYISQFREKQPTTYVEFPFLNKSGEVMWFGQNASLVIEGGKVTGFHIIARDITERKQAEERLQERERYFRTLMYTLHEDIIVIDCDYRITDVNNTFLITTGSSREKVIGKHCYEISHGYAEPCDRHGEQCLLGEVFETGKSRNCKHVHMRGDGSKVHVDVLLSPLKDDSGSVTHVVEAIRDVTDLIQAYEALQESEEKYRLLVENANEAIFVIQDGMLRFFNIKNIELIGYSKEELTSTPFINFVHPDDREVTLGRHLKRIRGEELPGVNVFRIIDKAGNIKWAEVNSVLISWEGRPAILNFLNDITERKQAEGALRQSEEKYRNVLENIEDGYYEVDIAGNFTFFNDSMCQIYGYPREELMGMSNRQYTDQENAKKLFQAFNKVYRTGESTEELDWEIIRKDGARRSIEASVSLIEDSSGNQIGFRGLIRDVTERKRAEEEKATLQEQLRQSQKIEAIGRLAGGIAHDFNNLLTVIKGYSQLSLIELKEGDPLKGNIEEVKKAADRAADLTRQLLAFSRRQILEMRVLDLNTVLRDLDKMLHRLIGEDIELVTVFTDDLGRVKTDPGWVEQIIMNLAVNARDAMPSVGKLTIETANVELDGAYARGHIAVKPGRYVMLSASDTGVGMTPEVRQQVFEPFFTTKEKGKGTGLGLSTVYGIVKQSGGNIWVYSEPGKGTTFKIYLPRVDEPLEEIKERVVKEELPHGSETILVVEDEEEVRKLAVRILKREGYTVLDAPDGDGALVICGERKDPIHLILTDVVMPGMSGRQLADRLGSFHPEMKVVYMSGYTDNAITHHGVLEKGMNYIQKPFTVDGLIRKVREVLDKGSKPAA